jgi:GAF domain-containing protein
MKRRSKVSGRQIKGRRPKTLEPKRRNAPKIAPRPNAPHSEKETEVGRLARELNEALERQTATSEVLNVISSSSGELDPVFNAILQNVCQAQFGTLNLYDGTAYRTVALHNAPQNFARTRLGETFRPHPESGLAYVARKKQVVQIDDIRTRQPYIKGNKAVVELADMAGARTLLIVPMLNKEKLVGTISIYRQEVRPFTDKQIELVKNFAAQAVIAIENARLLNELRQRTTDLTEALERQTATSEVLQVISGSPSDLEPVFATMLEKAVRICDATFGNVYRWDGEALHLVATRNTPPAFAEARRRSLRRLDGGNQMLATILATKTPVHVVDAAALPGYINRSDLAAVQQVELGGVRTLLAVPMLREGELIGGFTVYRQEVRPFTDKQIDLVQTFAAQPVIAIENARLLNELREALEQQTATSDVLQVISGSPGDLLPVFESLLRNATRLCRAKFGSLYLQEEGGLRLVAAHDMPAAFSKAHGKVATDPAPGGVLEGAMRTKHPVQIADLAATEAYTQGHPRMVEAVELGGIRTAVGVPMLKEDEPIGVITIQRPEVVLFDEKQIALLKNFAAQAVIAIENARLLNELRQRTDDLSQRTTDLSEALEQQTATSEVLRVISSSPGELTPVFDAVLQNATRICGANFGIMNFLEPGGVRPVAMHNVPEAFAEFIRRDPVVHFGPKHPLSRTAATKQVVHIPDLEQDAGGDVVIAKFRELTGARTILHVPMLKDKELVGIVSIYRREIRPFTDKQIDLVKNFAAQAVIAIENARLLNELRERTDQLQAQSKELADLNQQLEDRVADQVGEIERMSRLRRFLPPQVADLIVASGSEKQLESHRREITALFCDLRGFTGFTESADAEDVMALLRDYHAAVGELVIKYSGTLERYAGDGVMVIFNDPVSVENPALQAVLMALEMRDAIGALTDKWLRLGHDIGFGIGIAHGFATLGTIGFEGRFDYAAIGTVSNVASRLCDEAKPGQILISPRVLMAVEDRIEVQPVGEFSLKGIRRPLRAYNVVSPKSVS